jgi:aldehyde dehydrogenase (NAD+)
MTDAAPLHRPITRPLAEFQRRKDHSAPAVVQAHVRSTVVGDAPKLQYGPAPEESQSANSWFESHGKKLGHFIGNRWYHGPGQEAAPTALSAGSAAPKKGAAAPKAAPKAAAAARKYRPSTCPATKEFLCDTIEAAPEDVDYAVARAKEAQGPWAALSGHERAKYLYAIARHVQQHHRLLAVVESLDNGKSVRETRDADIPLVARHFYHYAGWAQLMDDEYPDWGAIGVVGAIVPWNFPLMLLVWKVAPALAMGNTVVLKPASYTRLSALLFAEICAEAGLPPGVLNIVTGGGAIGSCIADHPDVAKVAFTGSTPVGRILRQRIAGSGKKISLELGGKSPVIVFENADLDSAVEGVVDAVFFNQGQVCSAGSRLLVHESVADEFVTKLKRRIDSFRVGLPLDKCIDMAALVDESQYDTIKGFVDRALKEGAEVYVARTPVPDSGWYWPPTIITNVHPVSECVRDEIFGPVLAVQNFRSPAEAIALANNTYFGLAGSVWTENLALALEVALSVKAGSMWVNCHNQFDGAAGFGGYRESGFGRDGGREGLFEYMKPSWKNRPQVKTLKFPTAQANWPAVQMPTPALAETGAATGAAQAEGAISVDKTHKMYINGTQKRPDQVHSRPVYGPGGRTSEPIGLVGEGNRKDLRDAVEAASGASGGWGKRAAHNRAQICYYIAENLQERAAEFASRISVQTGKSKADADREVTASIERLFYYAAYADKFGGYISETQLYGATTCVHEPIGVAAVCCPDENPLLGFVSLICPLVVRGNTIVVIPSPAHPLSAVDLFEVFETSDLPAGVVNIVTGERDALAKTLAEHENVDTIWYFGTEQGSANVEFASAGNMKRSFVDFGNPRDWFSRVQGQGEEFLRESVQSKSIWLPMGDSGVA